MDGCICTDPLVIKCPSYNITIIINSGMTCLRPFSTGITVKVLITAPLGTFLHKSTYKFTFSSYIIRHVLNYLFGAVIRKYTVLAY